MEQTELKAPGLQFTDYIYESGSIQVDLALYAEETSKGIKFGLKYSTALFKQETMEHFTRVFREITNTVVENKETRLGDIEVSHQLGVITTDAYKNSQSRFDF